MTRYTLLREWVAYFAASAEDQLTHDLGADDAVNESPHQLEDVLHCGELTPDEASLISRLEDLILHYCSQLGAKPWHDEVALVGDPEWAKIRTVAADTLQQLPDQTNKG
jgi:hypothetical protein